jgi:hypothetical protein
LTDTGGAYVLRVSQGGRRGGPCIRSHPERFNRNGTCQESQKDGLEEGPTQEAPGYEEGACHTQDRAAWRALGAIISHRPFSNQCSCIVREHVPITYLEWKKVPKELKDKVWTDIKKYFQYPPDQFNKDLCRGHALFIVGRALRTL